VRAEIRDLQSRTRTTMIYVTHDQVEAMTLADRVAVLDRGRLQQIAPPREVYERPANAFVAGFIGNPPMNLFPARVLASAVPAARTAGVRPEAIALVTANADGALRAVVEHVECLGHESLVHARVDGSPGGEPVRVVARVDGMPTVGPGDTVGLGIDPTHVHLFAEDGRTLSRV
jgi:multiple sugar transport system ATP-binding protein